MSEAIQVSLDDQGRIVIPPTVYNRLGLSPGMTLIVENGEKGALCLRVQKEQLTLIDKQGVLVVQAQPGADLANITSHERKRRVSNLLQRVD